MKNTKIPHVHAEVIKAWADGSEIEYYSQELDCWRDVGCNCPIWYKYTQYRVKSETVVKYHGILQGVNGYEDMNTNTCYHTDPSHVQSVYDQWKVVAIVKTTFVDNVPVSVEII